MSKSIAKPPVGEAVVVSRDAAAPELIARLMERHGGWVAIGADGNLAVVFPDGGRLVLAGTAPGLADLGTEASRFVGSINAEPSGLPEALAWLSGTEYDFDTDLPAASGLATGFAQGLAPVVVSAGVAGGILRVGPDALAPLGDETRRYGRDDLKRGEFGSRGQALDTSVGRAVEHLTGLGDEDPGRRNGEKYLTSDNQRFPGEATGIGSGIDHLWLLGDFEYQRSALDLPENSDDPVPYRADDVRIPGPLTSPSNTFAGVEDTVLTGRILDPATAVLPVVDRRIDVDPSLGTVTLDAEGNFIFTPAPGYSGPAVITFEIVDPRTGRVETGTIDVIVAAVVDPPTIVAGAPTPEDMVVGIPIAVTLNDPDGSETIDRAVVTGVPPGAVVGWNTALPGSIIVAPDGALVVTGTTADIQALLLSLTLLPPDDFSGPISLDVAVTITERNLDPAIPGALSSAVFHHPFTVPVEAVADVPDVTGDERTTDEDTPVALPALAANLNDLDGSEVLSVEIRDVPAGAAFSAGSPDPARPGVWIFTPADIAAGLTFTPPANFVGDVVMQIVAIATEQSNGDRETVLAPVIVHVLPVDGPDVATSADATLEDTAVLIGDNISIVIDDPLGSESLSSVAIAGFPAGAVVTFTDTSGAPQTIIIAPGGGGIFISGGSEADIRAAVATVAVTPPADSDADIDLTVTATTLDISGATFTDTRSLAVAVRAVADAPLGSGAGIGDEDTFIPVPITVSLADADGSETLDFVDVSGIPSGSLVQWTSGAGLVTLQPDGTLRVTGTTAEIQARLASLEIRPSADSDVNFALSVTAQTRESNPSEPGDVAVPTATTTFSVSVTVRPVVDAPVFGGASTVNEDGIVNPSNQSVATSVPVGANIALSATDAADASEAITEIVVGSLPVGALVGYTPVGGGAPVSFTVTALTPTLTFSGGSEAAIRAALATLTLLPPPHSDADITLTLAVTKTDRTVTEGEAAATQTFNGTHVVTVAAVADLPTLSVDAIGAGGVGYGLEDTDIPLALSAGHPDATDGSERILEVLIRNVPAGFTLVESAAGAGTLAFDAGRNAWVVSGASDAAINDVLANLTLALQPATGGVRQHLDTDVTLDVTVVVRETSPTNDLPGGPEVALLDASRDFTVTIPVRAVADGVTPSGSSTLVEDISGSVGADIAWSKIDTDGTEHVTAVAVSGFPEGATLTYTPVGGGAAVTVLVPAGGATLTFTGGTEAAIRTALDTLVVQAPAQSDANISLAVSITTGDNDGSTKVDSYTHVVTVQAVADTPTVAASPIAGTEDTATPLFVNAGRSPDGDGTETLSVRITVPSDGVGPVGTLAGAPAAGVTFASLGGGVYEVTATGATAAAREALIDGFLNTGAVTFVPRPQWSGSLTGAAGIRIDAISTEAATGAELAPDSFGGVDGTSKTETVTTYVDLVVAAVPDLPVAANAGTVVQENNGVTGPGDPDLAIALGTRLDLAIADTDGSEGLSLTLSGLPTNLQSAAFGAPIVGVATGIDLAAGTITVSGASAVDVLALLRTLTITLADDDDRNFTVAITGTVSDTNGATPVSTPVSLTHAVVVQAVADTPSVDVGAATKPAVSEDSGFISYPVAVGLNDTDGSESFHSVTVAFSTPGTGAVPVVQFATTAGVAFDTATPGQVVLTGAAAAVQAALVSLQVRPGADNGEDITVTVTAVAVESAPSEDNNGAAGGIGGGIAGPEIAVPTATAAQTFVIPVDPVPDLPTLSVPPSVTGLEDTAASLSAFSLSGTADPDGSEARFVEVDTASFAGGTRFYDGAAELTTVVGGWLRIPEAALPSLTILPPLHFSGSMTLSVRATSVDTTSSGTVTTSQPAVTTTLVVNPVADVATPPSDSLGFEDAVVAFGADLANAASGIRVVDTVVGSSTNGGAETISAIMLTVPANTAALTYTLSGAYVPGAGGTFAGSGSAEVTFNAALRTYTITSTIITGAADPALLTDAARAQAEADIRATLTTFQVAMGQDRDGNGTDDGQQDRNGVIQVAVTTLDVKNGLADTEVTSFGHDVVILARADAPSISAGFAVTGAESGVTPNLIALVGPSGETIVADRSIDTDGVSDNAGWGSERLSVEITGLPAGASIDVVGGYTLPAGASIAGNPGGTHVVNAANETELNQVLANLALSSPYYSGPATLTVTAVTTEQGQAGDPNTGSGAGIDIRRATDVATITVTITPTVDTPVVKANAVGLEDTIIAIPNAVTLADPDGSESYTFRIQAASVPAGARIYGADGAGGLVEIAASGGYYTLTQAQTVGLAILPPQHFSTAHTTPDIVLVTETLVSDGAAGPVTFTNAIAVEVQGVADAPGSFPVTVAASEDEPYAIGAAIVAAAGGNLDNARVDADGSETLSFVLSGVPAGVLPSASAGTVSYLGGGRWSVSADAVPTLVLPPVLDYSGNDPYPGLAVTAVTQEVDSDQAISVPWPLSITVSPVINAATVDGFSSWSPGLALTETSVEASGVSLAGAGNHAFADTDGSETVLRYVFDLSGLIADAGLAGRLAELPGTGSGLDKLVAGYVSGTFDYYPAGATLTVNGQPLVVPAGSIVVLPADLAGVALDNDLFLDSNEDFTIPVAALLEDNAGGPQKIETVSMTVSVSGIADVPTVYALNPDNDGNTADIDVFAPLADIRLDFGGVTTDIDADRPGGAAGDGLGRAQSEDVYYILRLAGTTGGAAPEYALIDTATGNAVGLDNGDGTWLVRAADLADLALRTAQFAGAPVTMSFEVTAVAVDDGTIATSAANAAFAITVDPSLGGGGGPGSPPPQPTIDLLGLLPGTEDTAGALSSAGSPVVTPGSSTLSVAVMLTVPAGATVAGATWNPVTSRWVATAADFNNGLVRVTPPADFSGNMPVTIEAVATGTNLVRSSTGPLAIDIYVDPVADGTAIAATPVAGIEDLPVALNLALAARDLDGSETIDSYAYVRLDNGATLIGGYALVTGADVDASVDGQNLVGFYRVPIADVGGLQIRGAANWHGAVGVEVAAVSRDQSSPADPTPDADNLALDFATFSVTIAADADAPVVPATIPASSGTEDAAGGIALTGLSASLVDTQSANGGEILSVVISGAPSGTRFSAGFNNGDGSWTIPAAALATLRIVPPLDYAGTMALTLTAIALESSNGDEAQSSRGFLVTVTPEADTVEILTPDVTVGVGGSAALALNVRMQDDSGSAVGETRPELIEITFSGVPAGLFLVAGLGGTLTAGTPGTWVFVGSEAQSNALSLASGPGTAAGTYNVLLSAVTIDGVDRLDTPVLDSFLLSVAAPTNAGQALTGTSGGNTLSGGAGNDLILGLGGADTISGGGGLDRIAGGQGADSLAGGGGRDIFSWAAGDLTGGPDTITDFTVGIGGDALDLGALLSGYNAQSSVLADFVRISPLNAQRIQVDIDGSGGGGSFVDVVTLQGVIGLNVALLQQNGNLIV